MLLHEASPWILQHGWTYICFNVVTGPCSSSSTTQYSFQPCCHADRSSKVKRCYTCHPHQINQDGLSHDMITFTDREACKDGRTGDACNALGICLHDNLTSCTDTVCLCMAFSQLELHRQAKSTCRHMLVRATDPFKDHMTCRCSTSSATEAVITLMNALDLCLFLFPWQGHDLVPVCPALRGLAQTYPCQQV